MTTNSTFSNLTRIATILAAGAVMIAAAGTANAGHGFASSGAGIHIASPVGSFTPPSPVVRDHRGPAGSPQGGVTVGLNPNHPCARSLNRCGPVSAPNNFDGVVHDHR